MEECETDGFAASSYGSGGGGDEAESPGTVGGAGYQGLVVRFSEQVLMASGEQKLVMHLMVILIMSLIPLMHQKVLHIHLEVNRCWRWRWRIRKHWQ